LSGLFFSIQKKFLCCPVYFFNLKRNFRYYNLGFLKGTIYMIFNMPVVVYEAHNCVDKHSKDIAKFGKKALIVTGKHSARQNGSLDDVTKALGLHNISYEIFNEIEENPSIETVMKARELFVSDNIDFVIGIGGGSPLDAAKAIALMLANPDKTEAFLDEKVEDVKCLPVIAIPTTCGTGSEVTGVSVLTRHSKRTKGSIAHKIYPSLALVDSKYLKAAPTSLIQYTAIDALAHLIESYINSNATKYSLMFVHEGLRTFAFVKDTLLKMLATDSAFRCSDNNAAVQSISDEDYQNLMNVSTFAGMAIAHTGTSIPHGLSYPVTYELKIPHGKACAYFLAGYLKEAPKNDRTDILNLAGFKTIEEFCDFLIKVCNLTPISREIVEISIEQLASNEAKLKNCPFKIDKAILNKIASYTFERL